MKLKIVFLWALSFAIPVCAVQKSNSYRIQTDAVDSTGSRAVSTNYAMIGTLGQSSPIGKSTSNHFTEQGGWVHQLSENPLILYYTFDDGLATDMSGSNHDGNVVGATEETGIANNALAFNGTTDYVQVSDGNGLNPTSAVTLEAWINPSSVSSSTRQYLMQKSSETWGFYMASSKLYFYTDTKEDGGSRLVLLSLIQANRWTHVAGTYDENAGVMVLYVDGTLKSSKIQKGHLGSTVDNLYVGSYSSGPTYAYKGRVDELRIYNIALTQGMIQDDMKKGIPDEVLHYNFDNGTATDPSHCENNGKTSGVTSVAGYSANGLSFNGSGYVCVPDSATLDAEDALTVEAWVYPTNMAAKNQQYILQRSGGTWGLYIYKGNVSFFADTTNKGGSWVTCSASMKGNVWSHVAGVYDSKTGTMSLYMNGTLAASKSQSKELDVTPLSLYLGNGGTSTTYAFYGILDEMRIYRKALSKDEILSDAGI